MDFNTIVKKNGGRISRKEALANGMSPSSFYALVKKNQMDKVAPGVYAYDYYVRDNLFILQERYPGIVYSGLTALYAYYLSGKIPDYIEFSMPKGYRVRKKSIKPDIRYHIENNIDYFNFANIEVETMFGNKIKCYSKEKLIVEMIKDREDYPAEIFIKAIKKYLRSKDQNLHLLFECAEMRGIRSKVFDTLELLADEN